MSVDDLLAKADRRLTAADRDLRAGDVERSLSASYYAMFYAASAALAVVPILRNAGRTRVVLHAQVRRPRR